MKGKLLVIEGLDGCGKSTQMELLCQWLSGQEKRYRHIKFPDYANPSSALVRMYLNKELGDKPEDVNAYAASSFYAVDRYASYLQFWKRDYEAGAVILADRYTTSNAIYQMTKTEKDEWNNYLAWLQDYEYNKLRLPRPDLVLYLDMPVSVSQRLLSRRYHGDEGRKDLHEADCGFLRQCREAARFAAAAMGWRVISCAQGDAPRAIDQIHQELVETVKEVLAT